MSVLVFEVIYEVLWSWKLRNMKYVAIINDARYREVEEEIGKDKVEILKTMEQKAFARGNTPSGKMEKYTKHNLYGKVFWHFYKSFEAKEQPCIHTHGLLNEMQNETEIVKKYCELCVMIK